MEKIEETSPPEIAVLCVGRVFVDVFFNRLSNTPIINNEFYTNNYSIDVGGGAAITACGISRLGLSSAIITSSSYDLFGLWICEKLVNYNVDTSCFQFNTGLTNLSVKMSFPDRESKITTIFFDEASPKQNDFELLLRSKHLHVVGLNIPRLILLKMASENGITTSVDTNFKREDQMKLFQEGLPFIDYLIPNKQEVENLFGFSDIQSTVKYLGSKVKKYCIVKLGADGAIASNGKAVISSPALKVQNVEDTTGAGDAFNAGFIFGLFKGKNISTSLHYGNVYAALSIKKVGGTNGLSTIDEFNIFLKNNFQM